MGTPYYHKILSYICRPETGAIRLLSSLKNDADVAQLARAADL